MGAAMYLTITLIALLAVAFVAAVCLNIRHSQPPAACPWCQALQPRSAPVCGVCGGVMSPTSTK